MGAYLGEITFLVGFVTAIVGAYSMGDPWGCACSGITMMLLAIFGKVRGIKW